MYGYAGRLLRVNLDNGLIDAENIDPLFLRPYLGGAGLGARILYDEVMPGVQWSDPENRLILCSGPLGGLVRGSGNFSVVTKGAMTEGPAATQSNGYFGAYLRFAGFDGMVIQGRAESLSYLFIHDGIAELRDASQLKGKDSWETQDILKQELGFGERAMSVFCIGPAGENRVRYAALVGDRGHVAAHNGTGAVMGSKNLKAIAIARGSGRIEVHDAEQLQQFSRQMMETVKNDPVWGQNYRFGTLMLLGNNAKIGRLPFENYTRNTSPLNNDQLKTFSPDYLREKVTTVRRNPCWACQMHHCDIIRIPEGPYAGLEGEEPEYECYVGMGTQLGNYDSMAATALANEVDRLGLDVNETGWALGMIIEGYEKGILSLQELDGVEMTWGNVSSIRKMINKIAFRQGIGDLLAEGTMRAAQSLGRGMAEIGIYTGSGNTPVGHDHRRNWPYLVDITVANTGSTELHVTPRPTLFGLTDQRDNFSASDASTVAARLKGVSTLIDCLGVCRQVNREVPELLLGMIRSATGWDLSWEEALNTGLRTINLLRAFNIRHGYRVEREFPSPRYGSALPDGDHQGKGILPSWPEAMDVYYREMGWDRATGKPLPETLDKLGLKHLNPDLW